MTVFGAAPPSVTDWLGWSIPADSAARDGIDEGATNKSEILYQVLLNIDVNGVPAVDQLTSSAIGDTDGDGALEVLDAWGEPLYLQWQQEQLHLPTPPVRGTAPNPGEISANVWTSAGNFVGLSREHADSSLVGYDNNNAFLYSKPVLPTQIRPHLISERLANIDGLPTDYESEHRF